MFNAGAFSQFNADWVTSSTTINDALFWNLEAMRARSRELANNNEFMKQFLRLAKKNVVGSTNIQMQSRVLQNMRRGRMDRRANELIEHQWMLQSRKGNFTVCGKLSRHMAENLIVETLFRDGESLLIARPGFQNQTGYAWQFVDVDRLDIKLNDVNRATGNNVVMGVEVNNDSRPVGYHILTNHPDSLMFRRSTLEPDRHILVPAENVHHIYITLRAEQMRGVPAAHAAMLALKDVGGWREAAIINARIGANKQGYWKVPGDDSPLGDASAADEDDNTDGPLFEDQMPGEQRMVPDDWEFVSWDPTYPHGEFESFNKAMLRGFSSGVGVFYPSLNNDHENVNLSSIRGGLMEEREEWKNVQNFLIECFHQPAARAWLGFQLATQRIPLPAAKLDRFDMMKWRPRRWKSPDPLKDAQSDALLWGLTAKSLRQIIEDDGRDADDTMEQIAQEHARLKSLGIVPTIPGTLTQLGQPGADMTTEDGGNDDDDE